jgi:hypothetical protein
MAYLFKPPVALCIYKKKVGRARNIRPVLTTESQRLLVDLTYKATGIKFMLYCTDGWLVCLFRTI